MSLGNREHVEAVAIIRNLLLALGPRDALDDYAQYCADAGDQWLAENHPSTEVYIGVLKEAHGA